MLIAGIDEAGRGPVIGPMVLACVVIESRDGRRLRKAGVRDSKRIPAGERERLYENIKALARESCSWHVSALEIDSMREEMSLNEIEAGKIAELVKGLDCRPDVVYVDSPDRIAGRFAGRIKKCGVSARVVARHKADTLYPACSAASIIAKVERDREIEALAAAHGEIGSGYPSDPVTIRFLGSCLKKGGYPDIVRRSWWTAKRVLQAEMQQRLDSFA